jgi:serine/threonine protein kinase/ankyrin repeat protein
MAVLTELIGHVLDEKYLIDKQLGHGGMGAVYLATHLGTERPVAVKVIMPEFMTNQRFVERFKREAKAAGRLRHPNVVNVTDFGFATFGTHRLAYLVMEYLNGCTLGDMLKSKKRLPLKFIVDLVEQISIAVDQAHKQGIIHRDLKPDNVWLQPDGRGGYNVKVLDFGLAQLHDLVTADIPLSPATSGITKITSELTANSPTLISSLDGESRTISVESELIDEITDLEPSIDNEDSSEYETLEASENIVFVDLESTVDDLEIEDVPGSLTHTGAVLGTPYYMSPEQCMGKKLDSRTDIYSLGVIVYEMIAGEKPFKGNLRELLDKHMNVSPPPLEEKRRKIQKSVASLVLSALAKKPEERPITALAFATALRANAEGEKPILRDAFDIYRKHFISFAVISVCLYLPYLLFTSLIVTAALIPLEMLKTVHPTVINLLRQWHWFISLAIILFANSINNAAYTPIVDLLRLSPRSPIKIISTLKVFYLNLGRLVVTAMVGNIAILLQSFKLIVPGFNTFINYSLFAPVVIMEELSGKAALERSKVLVNRLRPSMLSIQVRNIFIGSMVQLLSPIIFVIFGFLISSISEDKLEIIVKREEAIPSYIFVPLAYVALPWLFLILLQPIISTALGIFYFRVRQAAGEILKETFLQDVEILDESNRPIKILRNRPALLIMTLLLLLAGWISTKDLALTFASSSGSMGMVEALLTVGANANARVRPELFHEFETTPLISSIGSGNPDLPELLLEKGADPSLPNLYGWTPLMEAINQGQEDMATFLINKGADVNSKNTFGYTALMLAADRGGTYLVRLLLARGADVNAVNSDGETALIIAVRGGHAYTIEPILNQGADITVKTNDGETPLDLALTGGDTYIIELLRERMKGVEE